MSGQKKHRGIIVPMITPFTESGDIDEKSVIKLVDNFIDKGVAPFIFGTTGEASSIPLKKRGKIVKAIVDAVKGRGFVYAGISSNSFEESVEAAKEYFGYGADAVVAHLPSYYPINENHMLNYYESLADNIEGDLLLYNITATTHLSIPLHVAEKLSHHEKIAGLKDSERDLERLETAIELFKDREDFSHLIGWGAQCANGLLLGSDGLVPSTGNFVPGMFKEMYDATTVGDKETAQRLQDETDEISRVYQKDKILSQSLAALKLIMNEMDLCGPHILPPLMRLSREEEENVLKNFEIVKNKYQLR
jgi:4-hydroxy-tetrahydrodipicolinate synthase